MQISHVQAWGVAALASRAAAQSTSALPLYNQTLQTAYGEIQGVPALNESCCSYVEGWDKVTVWRGIPFAADAGGANRFRAPQPYAGWNDTGLYVASEFKSGCPVGTEPFGTPDPTVDEDCLNLNIWSAQTNTSTKLPVMVWSYPAGGTNSWAMFDGSGMALQDVIVVTYNYRAGPYGWAASPELYVESGNKTTGNYGALDQMAAFQWVQDNIAAFGGDPERVTAVGQSAGSAATYHLLNSPLAKGLIHGAIIESGVRDPRDPNAPGVAEGYNNMSTSVELFEEFMSLCNVSTLEELRMNVSAATINEVSGFTNFANFRGTLDGYVFPVTYFERLALGPINDVPVMTGNTKDEDGAAPCNSSDVTDWNSTLLSTYGDFGEQFVEAYPATTDAEACKQNNMIVRDAAVIGTWNWQNLWYQNATSPVWTYFWDHAPPGQSKGAFHMSEITYIFNNLYNQLYPWEDVDYTIASTVNAYWANFIKTGNPNQGNSNTNGTFDVLPEWTPQNTSIAATFHLGPSNATNAGSFAVGYEQIPVADVEGTKVELLQSYWNTLNASAI